MFKTTTELQKNILSGNVSFSRKAMTRYNIFRKNDSWKHCKRKRLIRHLDMLSLKQQDVKSQRERTLRLN